MSKVSEFKKLAEELTFKGAIGKKLAMVSPNGWLQLLEGHYAMDDKETDEFVSWINDCYGNKPVAKKGK